MDDLYGITAAMSELVDKANLYVMPGAGDGVHTVDKANLYVMPGAGDGIHTVDKVNLYVLWQSRPELKALLNSTTSELRVRLNDGVRTFKIKYRG